MPNPRATLDWRHVLLVVSGGLMTWLARSNLSLGTLPLNEVEVVFAPVWAGAAVKLGADVYELVKLKIVKRRRERRDFATSLYS